MQQAVKMFKTLCTIWLAALCAVWLVDDTVNLLAISAILGGVQIVAFAMVCAIWFER